MEDYPNADEKQITHSKSLNVQGETPCKLPNIGQSQFNKSARREVQSEQKNEPGSESKPSNNYTSHLLSKFSSDSGNQFNDV